MKTVAQRAAAVLAGATIAAGGLATFGAREAAAQPMTDRSYPSDTVVVAPEPAPQQTVVVPRREGVVEESTPNTALISSGLFTLAIPYVSSVVVATQSDHPGDNNLYIPVAGPWIDLANRGDCGNPGQSSCDNETTYKVLLVADGVLQGIGALEILGGLLVPEHRAVAGSEHPRTQTASAKVFDPHVRVAPSAVGRGGYGLAAVGTF